MKKRVYAEIDGSKSARDYIYTVWFCKVAKGKSSDDSTYDVDKNPENLEVYEACDYDILESRLRQMVEENFASYVCLSQEVCPETGKLHGHALIRLVSPRSGVAVQKRIGYNCSQARFSVSFSPAGMADYVQCVGKYASKPPCLRYFELGERPVFVSDGVSGGSGAYSDCMARIMAGASLRELMADYPALVIRHYYSLRLLIRDSGYFSRKVVVPAAVDEAVPVAVF